MKPTDLTTLATLKTALKVSGSADDENLERIISAASTWIETQTGRKLKARNYNGGSSTLDTTEVPDEDYLFFNGSTLDGGGHTIQGGVGYYLPQYPVQANSVLAFGLHVLSTRTAAGETWDTTTFVEWRDYVVEREKGLLRLLGGRFSPGYRNYRVTCSAGYLIGDNQPFVPDDLELLCIELIRQTYKGTRNLKSERIGSWSREFDTTKDDPLISDSLSQFTRYSL